MKNSFSLYLFFFFDTARNFQLIDLLSNTYHVQELKGSRGVVLAAFPEASPEKSASSVDEILKSIPTTRLTLQTDQKNSPGKYGGTVNATNNGPQIGVVRLGLG